LITECPIRFLFRRTVVEHVKLRPGWATLHAVVAVFGDIVAVPYLHFQQLGLYNVKYTTFGALFGVYSHRFRRQKGDYNRWKRRPRRQQFYGRFDSRFDSNRNARFDSVFDSNANGRFAGP